MKIHKVYPSLNIGPLILIYQEMIVVVVYSNLCPGHESPSHGRGRSLTISWSISQVTTPIKHEWLWMGFSLSLSELAVCKHERESLLLCFLNVGLYEEVKLKQEKKRFPLG